MNTSELHSLLIDLGLERVSATSRGFVACCPYHTETRPSWGISSSPPHPHGCFSCEAKGTLATLLRDLLSISMDRALLMAGESLVKIGKLSFDDPVTKQPSAPDWFSPAMMAPYPLTRRAIRYLRHRGISSAIAGLAGLGYDPNSERVLFPWKSEQSLIAVTGRYIGNRPNVPKTLPMFDSRKSVGLYAPFLKLPVDTLVLVEGEIDLLSLAMVNCFSAAALGYGIIAEQQKNIVLYFSPRRVVTFFDHDDAGFRLTRSAQKLLGPHVEVCPVDYSRVMRGLPNDMKVDPASLPPLARKHLLQTANRANSLYL